MQVLNLETLPEFAQRELLDFYQFLLQKYAPVRENAAPKQAPLAPRLVKPFQPMSREAIYER